MKISKYYRTILRLPLNLKNRKLLKNNEFTIISSNCVGGIIYHELGKQFTSPTINLWFEPNDFIKFVGSIEYYISQELVKIDSKYPYPVGRIDDIIVYFMHYRTFDEAKEKWISRCRRISYDNIYVLMTLSENMPDNIVWEFDRLPYRHKAILTEKDFKEVESAHYMPIKKRNNEIYDLCRYKSKVTGRRWLDDFDYVRFLNDRVK